MKNYQLILVVISCILMASFDGYLIGKMMYQPSVTKSTVVYNEMLNIADESAPHMTLCKLANGEWVVTTGGGFLGDEFDYINLK